MNTYKKRTASMLAILVASLMLQQVKITKAAEGDPPAVLRITQVQITGGVGKTAEDFIELFNPNTTPVNLNGYRLVKRSATGTTDSSIKSWSEDALIPARSFFLWANSTFTGIASLPDATTSSTLAENNGVAIRFGANDTGTLVDSISWGTSTNGFANVSAENPQAGQSLLRSDVEHSPSAFTVATSSPRNSSVSIPAEPTPYATPYATPSDPTPYATPYGTPYGTPYSTPYSTPYATPSDPVPYATPYITPYGTPYSTPYSTPYATPYGTPYASPYATPYGTPYATPVQTTSQFVKISEIVPNPDGEDSGKEQVELVNNGTTAVNVSGWHISDQPVVGPAALALTGTIQPSGVLAITIPSGKFTLTNTGEGVYLFDGANFVLDHVEYQNAPSGKSWQGYNNAWQWRDPSIGQVNTAPQVDPSPVTPGNPGAGHSSVAAKITEVMANPFGQDAGNEWVEIQNTGNKPIHTMGWMMDQKKTGSISTNSLEIGDLVVLPGEYTVFYLPAEFELTNGAGHLRLFDADDLLIDEVLFKRVREGFSFGKADASTWSEQIPSPEAGVSTPLSVQLAITELLANPASGQQEFIEVYNNSDDEVNLENFIIRVGQKTKRLGEAVVLAGDYEAFFGSDIPALPNNGGKVELLDPYERLIDLVVYGKMRPGVSMSFDGSVFVPSSLATAGSLNEIELVSLEEPKATPKKATSSAKAKPSVKTAAVKPQTPQVLAANSEAPEVDFKDEVQPGATVEPKHKGARYLMVAGGALVLLGGGLWVLRSTVPKV